MRKLMAILSAITIAFAMFPASALVLETAEGTSEILAAPEEAALAAAEASIPDKIHPTYGELVMFSDFSGDDITVPTYSKSNLLISDVSKATAPDGTECVVWNKTLRNSKYIIVHFGAENDAARAYEDGTPMLANLTFIVDLYGELNGTVARPIDARYPDKEGGMLTSSTAGVATGNHNGFAASGWATATYTQGYAASRTYWELCVRGGQQDGFSNIYVGSVKVYAKDPNVVILKDASWNNNDYQRIILAEDTSFTFPSLPSGAVGDYWYNGTTYYRPGETVAKSDVAGKTFYPAVNKDVLNDSYGYLLTSWDMSYTWNSNYNSDSLFKNSAGDTLKLVGSGINDAHMIADPVSASNKVLYKNANAFTIAVLKRSDNTASNLDTEAKYTVNFRAYLDQEATARTLIGMNGQEMGSPELTPYTWENKSVSLTQPKFETLQVYPYNNPVYYDDIYVWCYPSDALIIRANATDNTNASMLHADGTATFPTSIGDNTVEAWTNGETMYLAGAVIPDAACGKTWIPCSVEAPECVIDDAEYPITYSAKTIDNKEEYGIRVITNIGAASRNAASNYGVVVTLKSLLEGSLISEENFTLNSEIKKVSGYSYIKEDDAVTKDIIYDIGDDASVYFSAFMYSIPETGKDAVIVLRPFFTIGSAAFYGRPVSTSVNSLITP